MNKIPWRMLLALLAVPVIACTAATANPAPGKDKPGQQKSDKKQDKDKHGDSIDVIAVLDAGIHLTYGDARRYAVDSHLTGYKPLPPGIRKNLARGKPMPPGIAKTRLPASFLDRLPAHDGYDWRVAGTDLVLVFDADLSIAGVLEDVFK